MQFDYVIIGWKYIVSVNYIGTPKIGTFFYSCGIVVCKHHPILCSRTKRHFTKQWNFTFHSNTSTWTKQHGSTWELAAAYYMLPPSNLVGGVAYKKFAIFLFLSSQLNRLNSATGTGCPRSPASANDRGILFRRPYHLKAKTVLVRKITSW